MNPSGRLRTILQVASGSLVAVAALAWALFGVHLFSNDGSVGRHIRLGRGILESGAIPRIDFLSHTMAGRPFVASEWLSEVIFAGADSIAGLSGVAVLTGLLFASAIQVVFRFCRSGGAGPLLASAVTGFSMFLQSVQLHPSPRLFSILFAAGFLLLLESYRREPRTWPLVIQIPLMAIWTNLHWGFLAGFSLLGVYLADAWRPRSPARGSRVPLSLVALGCLLATLVNPVGLDIWPQALSVVGLESLLDPTRGYRSPDFHQFYGKLFLAGVVMGFGLLGSGRIRAEFRGLVLFLGWTAASLVSAQCIPLFGALAIPWFAIWLHDLPEIEYAADRAAVPVVRRFSTPGESTRTAASSMLGISSALILGAATIGVALAWDRGRYSFDPGFFPVAASRALDSLAPQGKMFNEILWGGYLHYAEPDRPVFIDEQVHFYGRQVSTDYTRIRQLAPQSLELLDHYEIGWVIVPPNSPLPQGLDLNPMWRRVYADPSVVIYVRRTTAPQPMPHD